MTDTELDLDALDEIAVSDNLEFDLQRWTETRAAVAKALPSLIAAAKEGDELKRLHASVHEEYAFCRKRLMIVADEAVSLRALLAKAAEAMKPFAGIVGPFRAATETGRHHIPDEAFRRLQDTLPEINAAIGLDKSEAGL